MADLINFTLPEMNGEIDEKTIKQIKNYLFQLTEQMKFYLNNIDADNFTEDYQKKLSAMITSASTNAGNTYAKNLIDRYRKQFEEEIKESAELITGNKGGYIVFHDSDDDGFPDELLIMDTSDVSTAQKVWRWNKNGLMFENKATGAAAEIALTMEGKINANMITAGVLKGIRVEAAEGTIGGWDISSDAITTTWTVPASNGSSQVTYSLALNAENNDSENVIELYDGSNKFAFRIKRNGTADFNNLGVNNLTVTGDFTCLGNMNFSVSSRLIWSGCWFMNANQVIKLQAPDLATNAHSVFADGNHSDTALITVKGGTLEENALSGKTIVILGEKYICNSNTENSITLDRKISITDGTEIEPDDASYQMFSQPTGLLLVFHLYDFATGSYMNDYAHCEIFPKQMLWQSICFVFTNHAFSRWSTKIFSCTNDELIGNANNDKDEVTENGITYNNHYWVLTHVYGI